MKSVVTGFAWVFAMVSCFGQSQRDLFVGWNHLFEIATDINQVLQINPKVGQEGSTLRAGLFFEMENIFLDEREVFEHRISVDLGANKNSSDAWIDSVSGDRKNPFQKNYDQIKWRSKYSRELSAERHYLAAEHYFTTTLLPSFEGNYFSDVSAGLKKLSAFLSPMSSTWSVGYERRNGFEFSLYAAPLALKLLHVQNDEIAGRPAINERRDSVEFLGSGIHGNDLQYDAESATVTSFSKTKYFLGAQVVFTYDRDLIVDKLSLRNESRLFFDYLDEPSLDITINAQLNLVLLKGLQLGVVAEFIKDENLFFQSSRRENILDPTNAILKRGSSYTQRLVLRYTFDK